MADQINLRTCRSHIDRTYVGFDINGPKVKPVHIINGVLRVICGKAFNTEGIKRLSYVESKKGKAGYSTKEVFKDLLDREKIEEEIDTDTFESFRRVLQILLDADSAVFDGKEDRMISYTLSSQYFLTHTAMYEDAGEFIGGVIKEFSPDLSSYIKEIVEDVSDPISLLFSPVTTLEDYEDYSQEFKHHTVRCFGNQNKNMNSFLNSLKAGATCLLKNLKMQTNCFTQLRMFNFFCIYQLFRYLSSLEAFYNDGIMRPILLDFTNSSHSSIAEASAMSYAQIYKSLSRFYAWGYSQYLNEQGFTLKELKMMAAPVKQVGKVSQTDKNEIDSLWEMAKLEAESCSDDSDARIFFGMAMYNMLARESKFHPGSYLRALGILTGLLYPPNSNHNRFSISHDMLEMVLMCVIEPEITLSKSDIRTRLYNRMGIIIGGSGIEDQYLNDSGMILQVDGDALEDNFNLFTYTLESLGFADVMADGILQIRLGGLEL